LLKPLPVSRGDWIRTSDRSAPSRVRYQTAPRPEFGPVYASSVRAEYEHMFVEMKRRCGRCGLDKPLGDFAWRRKKRGQRHNYCRPCSAAYHREHYLANKDRYIAQAAAAKQELRRTRTMLLLEYFKDHPCADCGEVDPVVLEFDHLRDKSFDICQKIVDYSWDRLLAEIEKCEVVCANCHRRRTAERRGALRVILSME
jgi:hypothetical protein